MKDESRQNVAALPSRSRLRSFFHASSYIRRPRRLLAVVAACLGLGLGGTQAWAWYELSAARSALAHFHPEAARDRLKNCLTLWPYSAQAHLLASRASRQNEEFDEAESHLRACQRLLGGSSDDVALEWALLQAARGNPREVEEYLQHRAEQDLDSSRLVWEALAQGYIRVYRILDALACLDFWLRVDPDNIRALELRGLAYRNGRLAGNAAEDLRRVIAADPTREAARWRLVLCLLDLGSYQEALPQLEHLARAKPDDPEVMVRLARCRNMLGQNEQARQILDAVLEKYPEQGFALRTRGQFALADHQPEQAERWLQRAAKVWPSDYHTQWLLYRSLEQQNKSEAARAQLRIAEEARDRAERLGELTSRKLSEQPLDPALHYEMGVLLLRSGNQKTGQAWLLSALSLDPDYGPAHAALADYHERQGDAQRAAEHRARAGAPGSSKRSPGPPSIPN